MRAMFEGRHAKILVDVVVPAHDEAGSLVAFLRSVVVDAATLDLQVVVVANGCNDDTAERARHLAASAVEQGVLIVVEELPQAGKARALRAGDRHWRGGVLVHLDADTVLLPGALSALARTLAARQTPTLASPRPLIVRPRGWVSRSFARLWSRLPSVADDVIGAGCYAVNAPGRQRWDEVPDVVADDAWLRSRFAWQERVLSKPAFLLILPEWPELVSVVGRWRNGNAELRTASPAAGARRGATTVIGRPWLWPALPGFLVVLLASRTRRRGAGWARASDLRQLRSPAARLRPQVHVVVVTHNSRTVVDACLDSLVSRSADLVVTAIDNGSNDDTAEHIRRTHPAVELVALDDNIGFGPAANLAAQLAGSRGLDADHVLLVNPDARLEATTIDALVATAAAIGEPAIVGGAAFDGDGRADWTTCLAAPSLWTAVAFGTGLSMARWAPLLDPDALGGWPRTGVRDVPALTAAVLLVDRRAWRDLSGFDEAYWLYGEDVDLCVRARRRNIRVIFTEAARYTHLGGDSSTPADRTLRIMTGKATLVARHLPSWQRPAGRAALVLGVGIRAVLEPLLHRQPAVWVPTWRLRRQWAAGW